MTSPTPKPRAGEHITERERVAERIVQALHADFTTYNKAKVMLLLQPLSGIWPEPWQTEINKVAAERSALLSRNAELVEDAARYRAKKHIDCLKFMETKGYKACKDTDSLLIAWNLSYDAAIDAFLKAPA